MKSEIITGVDKLVQIIDASGGRISIKDAMKQMHVSKELIEEWANTLEESKTVSIEYRFFNTYLVRGMSKTELVKKAKEIVLKEEAFEENLNVAVKDFESESQGLLQIGKEFDELTTELRKKRDSIESELKHLYEFDKFNKAFQDELELVDKRSNAYVKQLENAINQKKDEYKHLLDYLNKEKEEVSEKSKRLNEFVTKAELLNKDIADSKKRIHELEEATKNIRPNIEMLEKEAVSKFLKEQEDAIMRISEKQKVFLNEIMLKRKFMKIGLKENRMIKERIDVFFSKQKQLEGTYSRLKEERNRILKELNEIMRLSEEYKVMATKRDVSKEFKKLQEKSKELQLQRGKFRDDLQQFKRTVRGR